MDKVVKAAEVKARWLELPVRVRNWLIIASVPTLYMPLAYIAMMAFLGVVVTRGHTDNMPDLFLIFGWLTWGITVVMCPLYLVWAWFSKILSLREKARWSVIITGLNVLGMPAFYIFMVRRYLGFEGRTNTRDEAALDRFLARCHTNRQSMSSEQLQILRQYCRRHRFAKIGFPIAVIFGCTFIYAAGLLLRFTILGHRAGMSPMDAVEVATEGVFAGFFATTGFFVMIHAAGNLWFNRDKKVLIEYLLAASQKESHY
jgi:hypothetical protein